MSKKPDEAHPPIMMTRWAQANLDFSGGDDFHLGIELRSDFTASHEVSAGKSPFRTPFAHY